jgi:hypothetical protein
MIQLHVHPAAPGIDGHIASEHTAVLVALLYLPAAITGLLVALELAAGAGFATALRLHRAYMSSSPMARLAAFGMLISATIHLALAPSHWVEDPVRAVLFFFDGVALGGVAIALVMLRLPAWRTIAIALLSAGIVAYAGYVVAGVERLDAVGIATKLVELAAIGSVLAGSTRHVGSGGSWLRQLASPKALGGFLR